MAAEILNFEEDVIEASRVTPVLVDFWAPWCGPCRVLGPVLERLAQEQSGSWTLVKINSDEHPDLSARFGIRGIPAVKLFVDGKVVDEFTGALPEPAVRQWLEKALPSRAKKDLEEAEALFQDDRVDEARTLVESILELQPTNPAACALLARILVFKEPSRARDLAHTAETGDPQTVRTAEAVRAVADFLDREGGGDGAASGVQTGGSDGAASGVQPAGADGAPGSDVPPRLQSEPGAPDYARAITAIRQEDFETAITSLIDVLKVNRYLDDDGPKRLGVALFTLLGEEHDITRKHRRTFDMWLY